MDTIVGIDLGTTNSEVAILRDGQPHVFGEDGDPILPSFVGLSEDGRLLVGKAARNQWVLAPERTIKSIKRKMGQDVKVKLGDQEYRPQEISAMILRTLQAIGPRNSWACRSTRPSSPCPPTSTTPSGRPRARPASWPASKSSASSTNRPPPRSPTTPTRPSCAACSSTIWAAAPSTSPSCRSQEGVVEVLASHGDTQLGGDDFDDLLLKLVCDGFQQEHGIDLRRTWCRGPGVLRAVEAAKRHLSYHPFARIEEEFIAEKDGQALHLNMELSRARVRGADPAAARPHHGLRAAGLDDAKLTASAIDKVVLVGGSTRTPRIGALLEERLGQPAHQEVNPDLCVAMGAAIQAAIIAGDNVGAVLVDITPHSLGIKCLDQSMGFPFEFRFAADHPPQHALPASRSEVFFTVHDRQTEVEIEVYQGEDDDVRRNHRVGKFMIAGPGAGAGRQPDRRAARPEPGRHAEGVGPGTGHRPAKAGHHRERPGPLRARGAQPGPRTARTDCGPTRRPTRIRERTRARPSSRPSQEPRTRSRRLWCPDRARASARRCKRGRCWKRPNGCWTRSSRRTGPRSNA